MLFRSIQTLMKDTGVFVDTACGGEAALRMIRAAHEAGEEYQMILLDWKMPDRNGYETAKDIRALEFGHMPILFLTAYDGEDVENKVSEVENAEILAKPCFVSAFREKLLEMRVRQEPKELMPGDGGSQNLEGLHLLVAEDNEINAEILSELLSVEGATCEILENGRLAVDRFEKAAEGEFDAILMDVQMPVMNGYDAAKAIRALKRRDATEIPIIAMTANAFAEDVRDALDAGMNVHIAKPIDMELLRKAMNQWIKKRN